MAADGSLTYDTAFRLMLPESTPADQTAALEAIDRFLACGERAETGNDGQRAAAPAYSLMADSDAILAEFQRQYHIDLLSADMHWWQFRALLNGLVSADLNRRIEYRTADTSKIKDTKTRNYYTEMRQRFALQPNGKKQLRPQTLEEYNAWLLSGGRAIDGTV